MMSVTQSPDRQMPKRPFYHLHFGPWCLMILGFAVTVYGVVRFQDLRAGDFELTVPCLIGGALVFGSALAERKIRRAEDGD